MAEGPGHLYRPDAQRDRLRDASDLARDCREVVRRLIAELPKLWDETEAGGIVPSTVWIRLKRVTGDLDSALDYVASELQGRGALPAAEKAYFPVARLGQPREKFVAHLKDRWAGLEGVAPGVESYILDIQHFGKPDQGWLFVLRELTVVLKHQGAPHHHLKVARFTATKEGYIPHRGAEFMIELKGFDGDLAEFLLHASEAILDFVRCLTSLIAGRSREGARRGLREIVVSGDHHATVVMHRTPTAPG